MESCSSRPSAEIGGQCRLAGRQPTRSQVLDHLAWYARQLARLGVDVPSRARSSTATWIAERRRHRRRRDRCGARRRPGSNVRAPRRSPAGCRARPRRRRSRTCSTAARCPAAVCCCSTTSTTGGGSARRCSSRSADAASRSRPRRRRSPPACSTAPPTCRLAGGSPSPVVSWRRTRSSPGGTATPRRCARRSPGSEVAARVRLARGGGDAGCPHRALDGTALDRRTPTPRSATASLRVRRRRRSSTGAGGIAI